MVNNHTFFHFCVKWIGRADIEGSKSNVAMIAWLPQASYPCGNFSDTPNLIIKGLHKVHSFEIHSVQNLSDRYAIISELLIVLELVIK